MSPQGLQAQATLQKFQAYDPKRDTKTGSLFKFLKRQASKHLESGVLPENERRLFSSEFEPLLTTRAAVSPVSARTSAGLQSRFSVAPRSVASRLAHAR